jgi:hypothetical protein
MLRSIIQRVDFDQEIAELTEDLYVSVQVDAGEAGRNRGKRR